jgi:hypothetical protein
MATIVGQSLKNILKSAMKQLKAMNAHLKPLKAGKKCYIAMLHPC